MVFKPFKPPSIRKPSQPSNQSQESAADTTKSHEPPAKRPRLLYQEAGRENANLATGASRKPLNQVKNIGESPPTSRISENADGQKYFNVLWRKPTAKKNKTWDGDGIISTRDGYVYLQDISGKDMGRARCNSGLSPGAMISIGGKEVEIDSEIPRKEYLSGKRFLETKNVSTPVEQPQKVFAPVVGNRTKAPNSSPHIKAQNDKNPAVPTIPNPASRKVRTLSAYKKVLAENTTVSQTPPDKPIPRHDPNQPGALVLTRPDSVPKGKRIVDVVVDPILAKNLRPHQREGVKFLYECVMGMRSFNGEGAILADEMGLGKTLQTITLLWTLLKQNPIYGNPPVITKALIVCPVTLINNWRKEFRKWLGNERIGVFVFDDKRKRLTDFTMGKAYSIMIVGYEKLRTVQEGLARGNGVDIVIADEGHRLKTLQNKSGQAIQSLSATKRIILSGTPIQNELKEFFAAVDLVNPGVLGSFKSFMKEFEGPIVRSRQPEATKKDIEKGEARNEELRELTSKFILRRTADILAKYLPPKTEYVLFCQPTSTQAAIYQNVLASPVFQCALGNSESALQLITILKKLCNSPSLLSPRNGDKPPKSDTIADLLSSLPPNLLRHFSPSSSAKIRVLDQLLHSLRTNTSEKIVLVSNYTSTLNLLANLLTSLSLPFLRLDGSTPAQKRQGLVEDFNRLPPNLSFAFLLSAKAGGMGLNLIGASRLVLFDVDWNPATDIQAMARIHRDGQKRPCHIYRILLKGSLEEKIWQRQVTKLGLADSVMENKDSVAQFSRDELKDLFRLDVESKCQTHDLLGCECGGKGGSPLSPLDTDLHGENESISSASDAPSDDDNNEEEEEGGAEDEDIDFPDVLTLLKASEVDIEKQERMIQAHRYHSRFRISSRHTTKTKTKTKTKRQMSRNQTKESKMHQSLAQYAHIDPSAFSSVSSDDNDDDDGAVQEGLQQAIDDPILFSLLKDEANRVRFIFKKSTTSEIRGAGPAAGVGATAGATDVSPIVLD